MSSKGTTVGDELLDLLALLDGDLATEPTRAPSGSEDASATCAWQLVGASSGFSDEHTPPFQLEADGVDASRVLTSHVGLPIVACPGAAKVDMEPVYESLNDSFGAEGSSATPTASNSEANQVANSIASTTCPTSSTALVNAKPRARAKRNYDPNKARNERAREIRGLRREAEELEAQLGSLRTLADYGASREKRLERASECHNQNQKSFADARVPPVWEAICRNQLERRVRAERENGRLKRSLDEHVAVAKGLQRLALKSAKAQKVTDGLNAGSTRRVYTLPSDSDADAARLAELLAEVDASYHEIAGIFEANGISEPGGEPRRGSHMRTGERGRFADVYAIDLLPFSVAATADVVWRFYSGPSKHRGPLYYKTAKVMEPSENTIVEKFAIELIANNTKADFRVWQVLRRYVEADRVSVVWMGIIEPVEFANKSFSSCGFREKGYVTCSRASTGSDADSPEFTRLRRCHRIVPYTTHKADAVLSAQDKREIGAVIEFVLSLDSIGVHLERFESELVQQSLRHGD